MDFTIDGDGMVAMHLESGVAYWDMKKGEYHSVSGCTYFNIPSNIMGYMINEITLEDFEVGVMVAKSIRLLPDNLHYLSFLRADGPFERIFKVLAQKEDLPEKVNYVAGAYTLYCCIDKHTSEKSVIAWINSQKFEWDKLSSVWLTRCAIVDFVIQNNLRRVIPNFDNLSSFEKACITSMAREHSDIEWVTNKERYFHLANFVRSGLVTYLYELSNWSFDGIQKVFDNYLKYCELLEIVPNFNGNFLRKFAETKRAYEARLNIERKKRFKEAQLYRNIEWCYDGYVAIIPTSLEELQDEGEQQHNCVGKYGYYERIADEQEGMIIFIRKEDSPHKSYLTVEVDADGYIEQCLAAFNDYPDETGEELEANLQKYLHDIW